MDTRSNDFYVAYMPTGARLIESREDARSCIENGIRVARVTGLKQVTAIDLAIEEEEENRKR